MSNPLKHNQLTISWVSPSVCHLQKVNETINFLNNDIDIDIALRITRIMHYITDKGPLQQSFRLGIYIWIGQVTD